jgi:hypothetical protein
VTGEYFGVITSNRGICWNLNGQANCKWLRTPSRDQLLLGVSLPSESHCSTLTSGKALFGRENVLFDVNEKGQLRTIAKI